jgi:MFS family permease
VERWIRRGVADAPARAAALGAVLVLVPSTGLPLMLALHASAGLALPLMWVIWLCAGLGVGFAFPALSLIAVSVKESGSVDDLAAGLTIADLLGGSLGSVLAGGLYTLGVEHLRWSTQSSLALAVGALVLVLAGTVWLAVAQREVTHRARPHLGRRRNT